jgi:hypothetical protein
MAQEPNAVELAVSRALRENLERIQKTADELHQAINDVVSACSSNRPAHALPPMIRAQASAASLSAALDVLARFVSLSLQPGPRSPLESQITAMMGVAAPPAPAEAQPPGAVQSAPTGLGPASVRLAHKPPAPAPPAPEPAEAELHVEPEPLPPALSAPQDTEPESEGDFDVNQLSSEEQELHRRANRVAKVSMQDIKMLRPEQVRLGRENKDICIRLKDDIEKAHREYDRRFKPIMDHPVDYFYRWMVEILAEGDPHALGDYPYATAASKHR